METKHTTAKGEIMRYGIPYQGSKNKIARWVVDCLPAATHFYDLFCGGCAVSHAAILSRKYKHIHVNDVDPMMAGAFVDCINGKYANENRFISHEEFMCLRDTDFYAAICFSFGNNRRSYAYDREKEAIKKALHDVLYYADCRALANYGGIDIVPFARLTEPVGTVARYEAIRRQMKKALPDERVWHELEHAERLQFIQSLGTLRPSASVEATNADFSAVEILPDSVVYCDIPYNGTNGYVAGAFDWPRFYDWALTRRFPVFVSEYTMPGSFAPIAIRKRTGTMCANDNKQVVAEKIFVQTPYAERYRRDLFV